GAISPAVGAVVSGQPVVVTPSAPTMYKLTVTDAGGDVIESLLFVDVAAPAGTLHEARTDFAAARLQDGRVFVSGGSNGSALDATELVDPARNWSTKGPALFAPRAKHVSAVLADGRVLIAGGEIGGAATATAEIYDPRVAPIGQVSMTGVLSTARASAAAVVMNDGRVLVIGGRAAGVPVAACEVYDPATGAFTATGSLIEARGDATATPLGDGRTLVAGGLGVGGSLATAEVYDPATGVWTSVGAMASARTRHAATRLADGTVLVSGGAAGVDLSTQEIYDPATGAWTSAADLATARRSACSALWVDGKAYVLGGLSGASAVAAVEIFDPATGLVSVAPSLNAARGRAAAFAGPFGVLLIGGEDAGLALGTFEIYLP
ncbi:MAG TPA: kelch repeat-containing protein, partial [Planctomycetota bacterium]|nr:kelch repeat-containing protein [Planctomycetota bacterium]